MTSDMWLEKRDMKHMGRGKKYLKSLGSLAHSDWEIQCFKDILTKDKWVNYLIKESVTKVFVEQPQLHLVW